DACREDPLPPRPVRQPTKRQADDRVQKDERRPQPAELAVGQAPLLADLLLDRPEHLAVVEVHGVDADEHEEGEGQAGWLGHGWRAAGVGRWSMAAAAVACQ